MNLIQKITTALTLLLTVAVVYLLVNRSGAKTESDIPVTPAPAFAEGNQARATVVAIVNGDSLNAKYDFIVEKSKDIEQKMAAAEERVRKEAASRQAKYDQLVEYANSHPDMAQTEAEAIGGEIRKLQMELDGIQERELGALQKKEEALQKELLSRVNKFLDKYAREKGIDYVLNKQEGLQLILFGNADYDITSEVLAGLNEEYRMEKEAAE